MAVFQEMFEKSFQTLYTWETQNLQLKMDVLQCNIVQQMLIILEGLVPKPKAEDEAAAASIHESVEGEMTLKLSHSFNAMELFIFDIQMKYLKINQSKKKKSCSAWSICIVYIFLR